jgi:hypothetical protein
LLTPVALLLAAACTSTAAPTTPPATCDSDAASAPESWAPSTITATITPDEFGSLEAVPSVQAGLSWPSEDHPGEDPTAPRVWRCDGYRMLALELTQADQPPGTSISATLPRTPCNGDAITSDDGHGTLRLVERSSWCAEDLGGSEAGFDGWWVDVTDADTGTYTWNRDITWTRYRSQTTSPATTPRTPVERSGSVSMRVVLSP